MAVGAAAAGASGPLPARLPVTAPVTAPRPVATDASPGTVTVHRCVDARGRVTLQDDACPKGSRDDAREMLRPKDPAPAARARAIVPAVLAIEQPPPPPAREFIPPPAMYRCTSYDGDERFSESYDPNPRCEPLVIYYPYPNNLTPAQALSCRWVEDSCVRLTDQAACQRWIAMRKDAASLLLHSFSDTSTYRKSELERITQIVEESCP
jgi:hypothetical protein